MKKLISGICALVLLAGSVVMLPGAGAYAAAPTLKTDSRLILTKSGDAVCGTNGSITAAALSAEFDGTVLVKSPSGAVITGNSVVPTDSTVEANGAALPVIISGDANGDGNITLSDVSAILQKIAMWDTDINESAAKVNGSGGVTLSDASLILQYIANWDVKLGTVKIEVDENPVKAANEDSDISLWFEHSTTKLASDEITPSDMNTYVICAAKNEIEDANLYITTDKVLKNVGISVTNFKNCYGDEVESRAYSFYYHSMDKERPDALIPSTAADVSYILANTSQGFLVKAVTTSETDAGLYEATVSIKIDGAEVKKAKVYLNVWNFTLDDADACQTAFGLSSYATYQYNILDEPDPDGLLYKAYYDFLLENRINAYTLPYDIDTDEADEYLYNPRVRTFCVAGSGYAGQMDSTVEQIETAYAKLSESSELMDKAYFYYVDEPFTEAKFNDMKVAKEFIEEHFPGGRSMVPLEISSQTGLTSDIYDILYKYCDIYCPKMYAYTPEAYRGMDFALNFLTAAETAQVGTYAEIVDKLVASGEKTAWWYFAGWPYEPYVTYHADSDGILPRIAGWQQKQCNVTGVLYYSVDDYKVNPYRSIEYKTGDGNYAWGNGILVYPGNTNGNRYGVFGPIGSLRIEYIRDGIEDYMYLTMVERLLGEDKMNEFMTRVTRDLLDYDADADVVLSARADMAEAIMEAIAD